MLAACTLHNIGIVRVLDDPFAPSYTNEGKLLGQILLTFEIIHEAIFEAGIDKSNQELLHMKHCIASQYGPIDNAWGSAVNPSTPEAIFFH